MNKNQYIHEITERTCLPGKYRKKIKKDLHQEFDSYLSNGYSEMEVIERMGEPDDIAASIYENYINTKEATRPFVEYKSSLTLFGLPLIHVVKRNGKHLTAKVPTAKGIIAMGNRAKGFIAMGNYTLGIIAIGNLSLGVITISNGGLGLFSFGNLVMGLLLVMGNLAFGTLSLGNLAIGYGAVGNMSCGVYAMGHETMGTTCLNVENYSTSSSMIQAFISQLPQALRSFFQTAVTLINHWQWMLTVEIAFFILILLTWVIICRKFKRPL